MSDRRCFWYVKAGHILPFYFVVADVSCSNPAVLHALSKRPSRENAIKADAMLRQMELPVAQGGYDVEPDRLSYALAILTCARCADVALGVRRAEANLARQEARAQGEAEKRARVSSAAPPTVRLDGECYNVVLTALAKCRQRDAPDRALRIIRRMEQSTDESVRPNIRSWNGKPPFVRSNDALLYFF